MSVHDVSAVRREIYVSENNESEGESGGVQSYTLPFLRRQGVVSSSQVLAVIVLARIHSNFHPCWLEEALIEMNESMSLMNCVWGRRLEA